MKKTTIALLSILFILVTFSSSAAAAENSLYDLAKTYENLSDFVEFIDAQGYTEELDSAGSFTVFAPTNSAFHYFEAYDIDAEAIMTDVLKFHISYEEQTAETLVSNGSASTAFGQPMSVRPVDGMVVLNGQAVVTIADIYGSNGVMHMIDTVMIPPVNALEMSQEGNPELTIAQVLATDGRFATLKSALDSAGLTPLLDDPDAQYTLFATPDAVFAAMPSGNLQALMSDSGTLNTIFSYHIVPSNITVNQLANGRFIPSHNGIVIEVTTGEGNSIYADGVHITTPNVRASNGVIHIINGMMDPQY